MPGPPATPDPTLSNVKALTFDVFGTVVDWRSTVTTALQNTAASSSNPTLANVRRDWDHFAQLWRNSYGQFTRNFIPGQTSWKDIDTHHRDSLLSLLADWDLADTLTPEEVEQLTKTWHFLTPWSDSSAGIQRLGTKYVTATLSNGNTSLLNDLNESGKLHFQRIISAADFKAYKPNAKVYLGACETLGLEPEQVAMVAAHLGDLAAARELGFRTVYVERPGEEEWEPEEERYAEARKWVDVWIGEGEGGLEEVARRLVA
ncbi:HAD-like domain-containing protein [Podospora australis]|uniref:HAD-like domain-containing protein n=1 Tax=Podospora australis TaxID=1536484 RepID=A0AAN7AJ70_9PEZI|nr:HAD-like domain-containing protein [Podospora australis]